MYESAIAMIGCHVDDDVMRYVWSDGIGVSSVSLAQNGMLGVGVLVELRKVRICKIRCATGSANKADLERALL